MPLDVEKFASHLRTSARNQSQGKCARAIRLAREAAGAKTAGHPVNAKDWGGTLLRIGFQVIAVHRPEGFLFKMGDIGVMQPLAGGHPAGHIAGFDGTRWVSDFVQQDFWAGPGYRKERPSYAVYRY